LGAPRRATMGCMNRRLLITAMACCPAARLLAQTDDRPHYKVSAGQHHEALSARFPVRFGMPGLLDLQVSAPELLMLPPATSWAPRFSRRRADQVSTACSRRR
jgi:hypothetical protein